MINFVFFVIFGVQGTMLDRKKVGLVERDANAFSKEGGHNKTIEPRKKVVVASSMMKLLETNQPVPVKVNDLKKSTGKASSFFGFKSAK